MMDSAIQHQLAESQIAAGGPAKMALALLESLSDPVYAIDRQWRITFANDAYARHKQMTKAALTGQHLWDVVHPGQRPRLEAAFQRVMDTGVADAFILDSLVHTGRWLDVRVFPVFDGAAILFRDITRRVSAERALATSEEHLRRALDGALMGDWSWNAQTDQMTFSDRALLLYGLGPEGQGITREALRRLLLHPDDLLAVKTAAERALADQIQYDVDYRVRVADGWRWMRVMGGPHIVDGQLLGMHGLVQDIHDRKLANERLREEIEERERSQQRQTLLIHELNHRVKNILAMVQAIAMQTLSPHQTMESARIALDQRLLALARAHDVLTRESWEGAELSDIITDAVAPHESEPGARVRLTGPRARLEPKMAVSLAMALHELATNAVKYGALSTPEGWVEVAWTTARAKNGLDLRLTWSERGGPAVRKPERTGFGTRLITRSLAAELGSAELSYAEDGVRCQIAVVLPR